MTDYNHQEIEKLRDFYKTDLLENVVPFWLRHAVDKKHGGFITSLDADGSIVDTDKGVWQQGRATWLFAELYNNVSKDKAWLKTAQQGIDFLDEHAFDRTDGRMWFHLTRDGRPIRKRRYAFSESFAAIAYGELALATGESRYADRARKTFEAFVDHNENSIDPKFTATRPTRSVGFPMIAINTAQELRLSIRLPAAKSIIDRYIDQLRTYHIKDDIECFVETVAADGSIVDHFDGRTLNPGHAIECAWFFMDEGAHRKDDELIKLGCDILDWMWNRGWDSEYGGLLYFVSIDGKPIQEYWHDMKFWWPHNEAIIATLMAYALTGKPQYARMHKQVHDWAYAHFPDPDHGEWFGYLLRDGTCSSSLKGNLWKGPFHLPRMLIKCWTLCDKLLREDANFAS